MAQAAVDNAKLNLEFTRVKAPISGRVSRDMVNEGNLIDGGSSNSTLLATIVATSPIQFYFRGSESDYLKYSRLAQNGEKGSSRSTANPVLLKLQDEADYSHEAVMGMWLKKAGSWIWHSSPILLCREIIGRIAP